MAEHGTGKVFFHLLLEYAKTCFFKKSLIGKSQGQTALAVERTGEIVWQERKPRGKEPAHTVHLPRGPDDTIEIGQKGFHPKASLFLYSFQISLGAAEGVAVDAGRLMRVASMLFHVYGTFRFSGRADEEYTFLIIFWKSGSEAEEVVVQGGIEAGDHVQGREAGIQTEYFSKTHEIPESGREASLAYHIFSAMQEGEQFQKVRPFQHVVKERLKKSSIHSKTLGKEHHAHTVAREPGKQTASFADFYIMGGVDVQLVAGNQ